MTIAIQPAIPTRPRALATARPAAGGAAPSGMTGTLGGLSWGAGTASAALTSAKAFADYFPSGSAIIGAGRFQRSPQWTRHLDAGQPLATVQPYLAGASAAISGLAGLAELMQGAQEGNTLMKWAGALDLGLAATSALSIANPAVGGPASLALVAARFAVALHG